MAVLAKNSVSFREKRVRHACCIGLSCCYNLNDECPPPQYKPPAGDGLPTGSSSWPCQVPDVPATSSNGRQEQPTATPGCSWASRDQVSTPADLLQLCLPLEGVLRGSPQQLCWMDAGPWTALCCLTSPATTGQPSDRQCWTGWRHVSMRPSNTSMRHHSCSWSPPALRLSSITRLRQQSCRPLRWVDFYLLLICVAHAVCRTQAWPHHLRHTCNT